MTFELPPQHGSTPESLRELEQSAPNVTPKTIRAALVRAAGELEERNRRADDAIKYLEEALKLRVGEMDSHSRATEIDRQVKHAMRDAVARLRG